MLLNLFIATDTSTNFYSTWKFKIIVILENNEKKKQHKKSVLRF